MLAEKVQKLLGVGEIKYDKSWLELPELVKQIISCLRDTKAVMNRPSGAPSKASVVAVRA
jgi:hypothetical protein